MLKFSVLILALNEEENLSELLPKVRTTLEQLNFDFEIIIVDGHSKDNTVSVSKENGAIVLMQKEKGYGSAFKEGLSECKGEWILTLDADHSHPPDFLKGIIANLEGNDIVIASRYVKGADARMDALRYLLSRVLSFVFRNVLDIKINDLSSGFRAYRRDFLNEIKLDGTNFDVLIELLVKCSIKKARIKEIPFIYEERKFGTSHVSLLKFALSYIKTLRKLIKIKYSL